MHSIKKLNFKRTVLLGVAMLLLCGSCEKWKDTKAQDDPRLHERKYCNDPEAVNYNWNFPGDPDNSVCYYPSDLFKGSYSYTDSVYTSDNIFDSLQSLTTYSLQIVPVTKNKFLVKGFCLNDSLRFTAERSTYRANADSTIQLTDTIMGYGQFACRPLDTLTGTITKNPSDTTNSVLTISWQIVSDTGIYYHRGTAIKQ